MKSTVLYLRKGLLDTSKLLYSIGSDAIKNQGFDRLSYLAPIILSICSNIDAITILSKDKYVNEMYMISRSIIEKVANILFLTSCEEDIFESFKAYSRHKNVRSTNRSAEFVDFVFNTTHTNFEDMIKIESVARDIEKFTSKRGRQINRWSNINLIEMINQASIFYENRVLNLKLSIHSFYEDSSEALHGTLYGSIFHTGIYEDRSIIKSRELYDDHQNMQLIMIMFSHIMTCLEMVDIISEGASRSKSLSIRNRVKKRVAQSVS